MKLPIGLFKSWAIIEKNLSFCALSDFNFFSESSRAFSEVLLDFVDGISGTDFNSDFGSLALPDPAKRALILHRGELTDDYKYMRSFIQEEE